MRKYLGELISSPRLLCNLTNFSYGTFIGPIGSSGWPRHKVPAAMLGQCFLDLCFFYIRLIEAYDSYVGESKGCTIPYEMPCSCITNPYKNSISGSRRGLVEEASSFGTSDVGRNEGMIVLTISLLFLI